MPTKVDEHLVKLSTASITIDGPLKLGKSVTLMVKGDVVKSEDHDNQDGTINRVFTVKGIICEEVGE